MFSAPNEVQAGRQSQSTRDGSARGESRRTHREQRSEISIRGHEDSTLGGSAIENHIVLGMLQSYRANVDRIMTGLLQESSERW